MAISAEDRAKLVALARAAVEAEATHRPPPKAEDLSGVLGERRGCFVTLTNKGQLRGCVGTFHPHAPLAEMIVEMGAEAAARDRRFLPVTPAELPELTIEVSVLSPLQKTDEPEKLQLGTHGIYIVRGGHDGCFLPEVATQTGWDVQTFLDQCCTSKAALPKGAWKEQGTEVYLFTSEKFDH